MPLIVPNRGSFDKSQTHENQGIFRPSKGFGATTVALDDDVIDRFLFRSGVDLTLEPTVHRFERDVFVNDAGAPLSDHDPLRVEWDWSARS